jgi:small subunit ribosomal protein S16
MLKIRLQRHGAKHAPFYRMVVTEVTAPRDGRFIEILGTYDPQCHAREDELKLNMERIDHWLGVGAQPTDTVRSLIRQGRLNPEAWLARAEKKSQSKAARRLKGATSVPSMDDSTGNAPVEDSTPPPDEAAEVPVEEPADAPIEGSAAAKEAVVSEPSAPDGDAEKDTTESEDSPVDEQPATDEEPVAEDISEDSSEEEVVAESVSEDEAEASDTPAEADPVSDSAKEASPDEEPVAEDSSDDSSEEEVAGESVTEDEPEAESSDTPADSPKEASAKDDTVAEEDSDGGTEEEKSKD